MFANRAPTRIAYTPCCVPPVAVVIVHDAAFQ
jgi:hypothetical protein